MPLLPAETARYPDNLLLEPPDPTNGRRWWGVYTKSRQEKALARQLLVREIPFYLPLLPRRQARHDSKSPGGASSPGGSKSSYLPLFPGYVFLYGDEDERRQALTTNRVVGFLPVHDQQRLYGELAGIDRLIASGTPLVVERGFEAGNRVRVTRGVLEGLEGIVTHRRGGRRLLVAVEMLNRGVSISLEDFVIETVG